MDKYDLAQYIANLLAIMEAKQLIGGDVDAAIGAEYQRACAEFMEMLDEAGNSEQHDGTAEA